MIDKLIVSHRGALGRKYGKGLPRVLKAIDALVAADLARNLVTKIVFLDDAAELSGVGAKALVDPEDAAAAKAAIDALWADRSPHYLVLLGAGDVIPFQQLDNPVPNEPKEPTVPSDLPYACEGPYSKDPSDFPDPIRVVGRLPDVLGAGDLEAFLATLAAATTWRAGPRRGYDKALIIAASTFEPSARAVLESVFGAESRLHLVPPQDQIAADGDLDHRSHYVVCHGAPSHIDYHGGPNAENELPVAHSSLAIPGRIPEGCVAVAECCFGAELFDPSEGRPKPHLPMSNSYLASGAVAFLGPTTTSYGSSDGGADADLMCRLFLESLHGGASVGRALLDARHGYLERCPDNTVLDRKTVAQFIVLGDPSVAPIAAPPVNAAGSPRDHREQRRTGLRDRGRRLGAALPRSRPSARSVPTEIRTALETAARTAGATPTALHSHEHLGGSPASNAIAGAAAATSPGADRRVHVVDAEIDTDHDHVRRRVLVVGHEIDGKLVRIERHVTR